MKVNRGLFMKSVGATLLSAVILGQTGIAQAEDWREGAEGRPVDCLLKVKGKTYLDGECIYDADKDGSFRLFGNDYFVYLSTFGKNKAEASWNASPKSSHAHSPLGELKREDACWVSKTTKICAWDKKSKPAPKAAAAAPIKFARGAFSTIVTGKLANFDSEQNYTIEVGKGQSMTIKQVDSTGNPVSIYLTDPKGGDANDLDLSCHSNATVSPTKAGIYAIKVVECKKADPWKGSYSLKVTVK